MTVQECYTLLKGDYQDAWNRFKKVKRDQIVDGKHPVDEAATNASVEKFMLFFLKDPTMQQLRDALAAEDYDLAFRCVHTLKGAAANVSFTALQASASELTEQLRNNRQKPADSYVQKVEEDYALVADTLRKYQDERQ